MSAQVDDEWREQAEKDLAGLVAALEEIQTVMACLTDPVSRVVYKRATEALTKHGGLVYG